MFVDAMKLSSICTYIHIHTYTHTHIHTYTHTYTYTHTHTDTYIHALYTGPVSHLLWMLLAWGLLMAFGPLMTAAAAIQSTYLYLSISLSISLFIYI